MSRFASKYWRSVTEPASYAQRSEPPPWRPAPEQSHDYGLCNEATEREYQDAVEFCSRNPPDLPKLLPSKVIERIGVEGCKAWGLEWPPSPRFAGSIQNGSERDRPGVVSVTTHEKCQDVCILSDLPLLAGLYDTCGKEGVYYEVLIKKMKGIIAIGNLYTFSLHYISLRYPYRRHCLQALSGLAFPWMGKTKRWSTSRRLPQILRGSRRGTGLHRSSHQHLVGRHDWVWIPLRHCRALLHA